MFPSNRPRTTRSLLFCSLSLAVSLAACTESSSGPSKDDVRTASGGKADGSDACATYQWYGDGTCDNFCAERDSDCSVATPITELLHRLPLDVAWADLSPSVRDVLEEKAGKTMAEHRAEWGSRALSTKEYTLLRYPTPEMNAAFTGWLGARFGVTTQVAHAGLARELRKLYLVNVGESRVSMGLYHGAPALEWDGAGPLTGFALPDRATINAQKRYAAKVVAALRAIPVDALSADELGLREKAVTAARSLATGSLGSFAFGGDDLLSPSTLAAWAYDVAWARSADGGNAFADDAGLLETTNAYFYGDTQHVNRGTVAAARDFTWPGDAAYADLLGDPATTVTSHDFILLGHWWLERIAAHPEADAPCTIYTDRQRAAIWDSFTADTGFNNDGRSSMAEHSDAVAIQADLTIGRAQEAALGAVDALFPELSAELRARVVGLIANERQIALMSEKLAEALDVATGNTTASDLLRARMGELVTIGGYEAGAPVRPEDAAALATMWQEVRAWLAARYAGGPVDVAALLPATVLAANQTSSVTAPAGDITIGLRIAKSKAELYSTLIHEAHHAVTFGAGATAGGPDWEGAATAAERQLLGPFLAATLTGDDAAKLPLYRLALTPGQARLIANTTATLEVYQRSSCGEGEPDTLEYVKEIVGTFGMTGDVADFSSLRAHYGVQYLGYMLGEAMFGDVVAWLEDAIRPGVDDGVDPYALLRCGIFHPQKDDATKAALTACLGL